MCSGCFSCRLRLAILLTGVGALLVSAAVWGETWRVPSQHPTICGAVDSAAYGDTVLVEPGTYYKETDPDWDYHWIVMKDGVTLISELGPEVTILVEMSSKKGNITIWCDSVGDARIEGFAIMDANPAPAGENWDRAIGIFSSDVTITNNVIHHFETGIWVSGEPPQWELPVIYSNEIYDCLYGIDVDHFWILDSPYIVSNHIHDCHLGIRSHDSAPYIGANTIENNDGIGLVYEGCSGGTVELNRIINNGWAGVYVYTQCYSNMPCLNCRHYKGHANDVYGNGEYEVYCDELTGLGLFEAAYNYWGTVCPDSSRFYGEVNWTPWVDSTHMAAYSDCRSPDHSTRPTTWGTIKAIFK